MYKTHLELTYVHTFQDDIDDADFDGDYEGASNRRYNLEYDLIRDGVVELI